jgi:hypothetical protein
LKTVDTNPKVWLTKTVLFTALGCALLGVVAIIRFGSFAVALNTLRGGSSSPERLYTLGGQT